MSAARTCLLSVSFWLAAVAASAQEDILLGRVIDVERAAANYMLHCQGCHLPRGEGIAGLVPDLRSAMGKFLQVPGGREFLVRVPGSANAVLGNEDLADLLNWLLVTTSADELNAEWNPYTAGEVGRLRVDPLLNVAQLRASLVAQMAP